MAQNYAAGIKYSHFYNELPEVEQKEINKDLPDWIE